MIRTGDEYRASLKHGGEIYISDEPVHQKKPNMTDTTRGTFLGTTAAIFPPSFVPFMHYAS